MKSMILLMEEILHQLIGSLYHYVTGFFYIPGGAGFLPSTLLLGGTAWSFSVLIRSLFSDPAWNIQVK